MLTTQIMRFNRIIFSVAAVYLFAGLFSPQAHAGVYDDCKAWWHFDYDADSNGMASVEEIRNQLDWGTTANPGKFNADDIFGIDGGPAWTNEVVSPAHGNTYGGMSMYFRAPTNATGAVWSDSFKITDEDLLLHNSATIVTRFRWEGYANAGEQKVAWIYNNGLGWSDYTGWMFGIRDGSATAGYLGMYVGRTPYTLGSMAITTGVWYEAAAVMTDNGTNDTVELYLWKEGATTIKYYKHNSSAVTNASTAIRTIIGAEANNNGYTTGNALKCFKGAINHIAVWDRALSSNEIYEAFCYSQQPLIQVGIDNSSQSELRYEDEVDETYYPGDPWHTMPRGIKTGKDVILKVPMNAGMTSVDYALHLNTYGTDAESSRADVSLIVNATTNDTRSIGRHQEAYWFIPKKDLISGTNTFKLHYKGGTSAFLTFDWLELGGSWQIGIDNNSAGEFVIEGSVPDDFYVSDPDWQHLERALTSYGEPTINIHFALSSRLLSRYLYTYTTRVVSQSSSGTHAFSIGVNGTNIYSTEGLPNNTLVSVPIPSELMAPGMNEINLIYDDTSASSYTQFDFHRLELHLYGTLMLLR